MKLWSKGKELNKLIEDYTVGDDYILDRKLLYYDCQGSIAHAMALEKDGILSEDETGDLVKVLEEIKEKGLDIRKEDEDVHTAIENYLCEKLGEAGKKIHAGRSRNDQVMVDIQLWCRDEILKIYKSAVSLCDTINDFSRNNPAVMPGYTHMQKAMPSSLQLLAGSYIESILDDLLFLKTAYRINNRNPLGSAAGYGSTLKPDRDYTAELLGFEGNKNCIYVQNRPKLMSSIVFPLCNLMKSMGKISSDLLVFTMREFEFFSLPDELCTGSSIMPQKKNYDVLELVRGKSSLVYSLMARIDMIGSGLPSGYNRDYQLTKGPLMEAFDVTLTTLEIMKIVFENLEVNKEAMRKALTGEIFATDRAYELVRNNIPFRDAYRMVAKELGNIEVPLDITENREFLKFKDYKEDIDKVRELK